MLDTGHFRRLPPAPALSTSSTHCGLLGAGRARAPGGTPQLGAWSRGPGGGVEPSPSSAGMPPRPVPRQAFAVEVEPVRWGRSSASPPWPTPRCSCSSVPAVVSPTAPMRHDGARCTPAGPRHAERTDRDVPARTTSGSSCRILGDDRERRLRGGGGGPVVRLARHLASDQLGMCRHGTRCARGGDVESGQSGRLHTDWPTCTPSRGTSAPCSPPTPRSLEQCSAPPRQRVPWRRRFSVVVATERRIGRPCSW